MRPDPVVVWFGAVECSEVALTGAKAARLSELTGRGFPVPPAFVVTTAASRQAFDSIGLLESVETFAETAGDGREAARRSLQDRVIAAELPDTIERPIREAHQRLVETGEDRCAVRSSATLEDSRAASFAGLHGTYYYVDGPHLLSMIQRCWASLWSAEAVAYRASHGIHHGSVQMAVIVQRLIPAQVSGVGFTADPVTGSRDRIVVEASWGLGAAIVDGRVTPDRYLVSRDGLTLVDRRLADKRFMIPGRPPEPGSERLSPVPPAQRRAETLASEQLATVAGWCLKAEQIYGSPQDVEWAFADGQFHVLQTRPITVLGPIEIGGSVDVPCVLFKPVVENFTEPFTPLTSDLVDLALPPGARMVQGWLYLELPLLKKLLPLDLSDRQLADHLYAAKPVAAGTLRLSWARLPLALALGATGYLMLSVLLHRTRHLTDGATDSFRSLCDTVENDPDLGPVETLHRLWVLPRPFDPIGHMPVFVNVLCGRFLPWLHLLQRLLQRWVPDLEDDAAALLCSGSEEVLSAQTGHQIRRLAQEAESCPAVRRRLETLRPQQALEELRSDPEAEGFLAKLDTLLASCGHRAIRELELRTPRWAEEPWSVLGLVRSSFASGAEAERREAEASRARHQLESRIRGRLARRPLERWLGLRWRLIRLARDRARYYFKLRENTRFFHIMAFRSLRQKLLAIEKQLLERRALRCRDDIFFLRLREVLGLRAGQLLWGDVEERIRERRIEHLRLARQRPPKTLGVPSSDETPALDDTDSDLVLAGQPASPGQYEGLARLMNDPSRDTGLRRGEVLVAPYTDPAWTPLFLVAGAAVVEVGSYLSHAGTVAREYAMPCVVDATGCMERLRTGMRVRVDGRRGTVQILEDRRDRA